MQYSIIAGNQGVFDPAILQKPTMNLPQNPRPAATGVLTARRASTVCDLMLRFQSPYGDGAVSLDSATLEGVDDRIVLPYSHLEFLTGFTSKENISGAQRGFTTLA